MERPPFNTSTKVNNRLRGRSATPRASASRRTESAARKNSSTRLRVEPPLGIPAGGYAEQHVRAAGRNALLLDDGRSSGRIRAPNDVVRFREMLSELVHFAQHLDDGSNSFPAPPSSALHFGGRETRIDVSPLERGGGGGKSADPQVLKKVEIERIVRRVEAHFVARLAEGQEIIDQQATLIRQLRQRLAAEKQTYEERIEDLEKRIANNVDVEELLSQNGGMSSPGTPKGGVGVAAAVAIEQLKQLLHFEKRQRLQCEEQSQLMAEQHNRVVQTLEQRLRRTERQLQEQSGCGTSSNGSLSVRQTPRSAPFARRHAEGGLSTPATLHISAHADPLALPSAPLVAVVPPIRGFVTGSAPAADSNESPPSSIRHDDNNNPFSVNISSRQLVPSGVDGRSKPPLQATIRGGRDSSATEASQAADDVASFLDNITRELDSINVAEAERNAAIQRLI